MAADEAVAGEVAWARDKRALLAMLPIRRIVRVAGSGEADAKSFVIEIGDGASKCHNFVTVM